ncbi:peptide deformylase [candidate division Kazan bacterium RBG_13_50_9]|uniref:Peptide deformylase n=1 Tax=candidate division Kazan bacterium RBG_13_50_9 TaxID=1798535 RepID=A0A1F4NRH0_UNCK3|nr:MAG: peptide deformylase [candidate division Kazan bacterium RBG_13_50_9]
MKRKVVLYNNPLLLKKSAPVREVNAAIQKLAHNLIDTMRANNGVGLSAPQIGMLKRIIAYEYKRPKGSKDITPNVPLRVLINPEIIKLSKKTKVDEEGCLSFPDLFGQVKRSTGIRVRALNSKGKLIEFDAKDFEARIIQHEVDHLDGILFIQKLTDNKLYTYK